MSTESITVSSLRVQPNDFRVSNSATEEELVTLAQNGSSVAGERLIQLYGPSLKRLCRNFFLAGADCEDVIQEALVGLVKAIKSFNPSCGSSFRSFAMVCATRQLRSAVRHATRTKHCVLTQAIDITKPSLQTGNPALSNSLILDLPADTDLKILTRGAGLTEFEKQVLEGVLLGETYSAIGTSLGCPVKAVDNGIQRARRKILIKFRGCVR